MPSNDPIQDESGAARSERVPRSRHSGPAEREGSAPARDVGESGAGQGSTPWWHSKLLVTLITVIGAAIAPLTAWLSAHKERELETARHAHAAELQLQQQQHAIRIEFFEKVVTPSIAMTPESRLEALRYFRAVLPPGDLRKWAELEHDNLAQLLRARNTKEEERERAEAEAAEAAERARSALEQLEGLAEDASKRSQLLREADENASAAKQRVAKAQEASRETALVDRQIQRSLPKATPRPATAAAAEPAPDVTYSKLAVAVGGALPAVTLAPAPATAATKVELADGAAAPVEIGFSAERTKLSEGATTTYYRFSVGVAAAQSAIDRIVRVEYRFDHPTFSQKALVSENRGNRFTVSYRGWGCLDQVTAKVTLRTGQVVSRTFDMCALLR